MPALRDWFDSWTVQARLALTLILIVIVGSVIAVRVIGVLEASLIVVPLTALCLNTIKPALSPSSEGGTSKLALASLGVAAIAAISASQIDEPMRKVLEHVLTPFPDPIRTALLAKREGAASSIGLLFLATVIIAVNLIARKPTLPKSVTDSDAEFPRRDYKRRLAAYAKSLANELDRIDQEANWSDDQFVALDAQVEVRKSNARRRKVTNLMRALRTDRVSRVFLVLGDPGSGKSVALRRLCRQLLKEVSSSRRLPVYINLREWQPSVAWTRASPPTGQALFDFVLANLKARADVFGMDFLNDYFKRMLEHGHVFLILDSFDEIPAVLDVDERSWLIDALSSAIDQFVSGMEDTRIVIASRLYRKPSERLQATAVLEIRALSDRRVVELFARALGASTEVARTLFRDRREFLPLARNPFTAALIASYARENHHQLPRTQSELYEGEIRRRLALCGEQIAAQGTTVERLMSASTAIAYTMYETESLGLEAPLAVLSEKLLNIDVHKAADLLTFARLARLGGGAARRFSFVHRRFNEFFLVRRLLATPEHAPTASIPSDGRFRDALVLYCELTDEAEAERVADFCWLHAQNLMTADVTVETATYRDAVHSLRFLADAFRTRRAALSKRAHDLAHLIETLLDDRRNLLEKKLAVEATGLLDPENLTSALVQALEVRNPWIDETALRACQYVPSERADLTNALQALIKRQPPLAFLVRYRDLEFALGLSEATRQARTYLRLRLASTIMTLGACVLLGILQPQFGLILTLLYCWGHLIDELFSILAGGFRAWHRSGPVIPPTMASGAARSPGTWMIPFMSLLMATIPPITGAVGVLGRSTHGRFTANQIAGIGLTALVLSFPYMELPEVVARLNRWLRQPWRSHLSHLAVMAAGLLILAGMMYGGPQLEFIAPMFSALMSVLLVYNGVIAVVVYVRDGRSLRRIGRLPEEMRREDVQELWDSLKTDPARKSLVSRLRSERVRVLGSWKGGRAPYVDNSPASTALAQLDEVWLGLSR
jgi:hypothetical protein